MNASHPPPPSAGTGRPHSPHHLRSPLPTASASAAPEPMAPCPQSPSALTLRADDACGEARARVPAAQAAAVVLAVAQGHLVASALHTAQHHLRHVAGIPVPCLLGWVRQAGPNAVGDPAQTHSASVYPAHPLRLPPQVLWYRGATSHHPSQPQGHQGSAGVCACQGITRRLPASTYRHRVQGVAQAKLAAGHHGLFGGPAIAAHRAPLTAALHLHAALKRRPPAG